MNDPRVRLFARALLAGALVVVETISSSQDLSVGALKAALVAGLWACLEYLTPLNKTVGVGSTTSGG